MQLTTKGRYAVTAMLDLASNDTGKPITLDIISQRQNISLSYLEQLFSKLRRAELVKSVRGPGGGYLLDVAAKDINLTQIIEAVDENIDLRRCKGMSACNNGRQCISHQLWCEVSEQIRTFLTGKTLQMVIDDHNLNKGL
jgi:Rrf2 family transcriptional regulator, iron-sulfur cluster assembly transcription factor